MTSEKGRVNVVPDYEIRFKKIEKNLRDIDIELEKIKRILKTAFVSTRKKPVGVRVQKTSFRATVIPKRVGSFKGKGKVLRGKSPPFQDSTIHRSPYLYRHRRKIANRKH